MRRQALLVCGIVASLVYVAANVLGAMRWNGYSSISQTVSELSAIDAPSRPILVPLMLAYSTLMIAFGVGVWLSADRQRALRIDGALLAGYGLVCVTGPFTPMHLRGTTATLTDTLHIAGAMVDVLFILLVIGFAARAFGELFHFYSLGTIVVLLSAGGLTALYGPRVAANLPTPWAGVLERISIGAFLLWIIVLALTLWRRRST